jgi:UDP-4-amino-4-deoxy-L-arabinose formyltransferase/UDP-glucuronic acid dehydrogenase (UDP-4-keto-hexauronic acid decarboxylating)
MRMRFVLAGNERIGYECLKILLQEKQHVAGVITDSADNKCRLENRRIKFLANQAGIKLYEIENINDPVFLEELKRLEPDVLFNIAFLQLYKAPVLAVPKLGCINFHPGPLPRYGGSNGWVWAIINGEKEYGVAFHYMKEKVDAGDIIGLERFLIEEAETGLSLLMKCYDRGVVLFGKTLRSILEDKIVSVPQDMSRRSYYYNKAPYDGMIDISWSVTRICDYVRAMNFSPFPNPLSPAMISFGGAKIIVTKATPLGGAVTGKSNPGEVVDVFPEGVVMQTGDGVVLLTLSETSMPSVDTGGICAAKGIVSGALLGC